MREEFNSDKCLDIKPWVKQAITEEEKLSKDRMWKNEPDADEIHQERLKRIRFLHKHGKTDAQAENVAQQLETCESNSRCLSGACPECGRLLQRWFVRRSKTFVREHLEKAEHELVAITIVPAWPIVLPGTLATFSVTDLQRRIKYALKNIGLEVALGGVDFSFNEDYEEKYKPFWSPHIYLITSTENRQQLQRKIRKHFEASEEIPRPVKIPTFENIARRRSYALKMNFKRRIGYDDTRTTNDGTIRYFRNTNHDELRAAERLELFVYLDQVGLAARVIFVGAKPVINSSGVTIERC